MLNPWKQIRVALALALMAIAPMAGAVEMEDLIGDWNTLVYAPDGPQLADLIVEEGDDDGLFAISRSALGEVEIEEITLEDGKFKLAYWVVFNGVNSDIVLTIDLGETPGDSLTGKVAMNQGALQLDFIGAKKGTAAEEKLLAEFEELKNPAPAAAESADAEPAEASDAKLEDLAGKWVILVNLPEGPQMANIDVQGDADGLTATLTSPLGTSEIDDIELEDGEHVLTYLMDLGGQQMDIQVLATVDGDALDGTILVGGGAMELAIEGAREGTDAATELAARAAAPAHDHGEAAAEVALEDFVGEWVILVLLPDNPSIANLAVEGDAEALTATLASPLGESEIDDIELLDGQHVLTYLMDLGGQPTDIEVTAKLSGDTLTGNILVAGGAMEVPIEGARAGTDAAAALEARTQPAAPAETAPVDEAEAESSQEEPASQPAAPAEGTASLEETGPRRAVASATVGDHTVSIDFGRPSTEGPGYKRMAAGVPDGFVWRLGMNQATKLTTDATLRFGEVEVAAGEYGLWARRSGDQWDLIVNSNAKVWGIPYRPDGEIATIPMNSSTADEANELLTITIEPAESGGTIRVQWGDQVGTVDFEIAG